MNEHSNHRHGGFFVLRTPLLPLDELHAWSEGLEARAALAERGDLAGALDRDRQRLRERLRRATARAVVREALFVASPSLAEAALAWHDDPESDKGSSAEPCLVRYFQRMTARPTPFGLFAGCAVGPIGAHTELTLGGRDGYRRHLRLDIGWLARFAEVVAGDPRRRLRVALELNSSLSRMGDRLRWIEVKNVDPPKHELVGCEASEAVLSCIERVQRGATPADLVAAIVAADAEVSADEAQAFVDELCDGQLVVPAFGPRVTSDDPAGELARELGAHPDLADMGGRLEVVLEALSALAAAPLGARGTEYRAVSDRLAELCPGETTGAIQVDMIKPAPDASLDAARADEVLAGVRLLHRMWPRDPDPLQQFRERFVERYDTREVPLLEALDEELGVGFSPPLSEVPSALKDAVRELGAASSPGASWTARDAWLLRRVGDALRRGEEEIALDDRDVAALTTADPRPLPDSFAAVASWVDLPGRAEPTLYLHGLSTPNAGILLSRFCYAEPRLRRGVGELLAAEQAGDGAIFAEVVHLPAGRQRNVAVRPALGGWEIPFLGRSGAPAAKQISVSDLRVSVVGDRVRLTSARLGCEVIPRLTTPHNYNSHLSLGVYRFLGTLRTAGSAHHLRWNWGAMLEARFLPRLTAGRQLLCPQVWNLLPGELSEIGRLDGAAQFVAAQRLRDELRLPRHVSLVDGDMVLPVDLDNVLSVSAFAALVKKRPGATLCEQLDSRAVRGPEGHFAYEVVVPFVRGATAIDGAATARRPVASDAVPPARRAVPRTFAPGSDWLFAKIYTGQKTTDRVLLEAVAPLVTQARAAGLCDRWFFVRYADPRAHLRLRFHGDPRRLHGDLLPALHEAVAELVEERLVWRVQLDTYEREVERYGGEVGIELAEEVFEADSDSALGLLESAGGEDDRWRLALSSMQGYLDDFGLRGNAARQAIAAARAGLATDLRGGVAFDRALGVVYRRERGRLLQTPPGEAATEILRARSARVRRAASELGAAHRRGAVHRSPAFVALQLMHMSVNRSLAGAHRQVELALYSLLDRIHESRLARERRAPAAITEPSASEAR